MTVVCGDSHTSTHGAFAALAFRHRHSEVEHVLATQCVLMKKAKAMLRGCWMAHCLEASLAKDIALAIIGRIGTCRRHGLRDRVWRIRTVRSLSMEGRMTLCNMAIEAGARAGMVAVDGVHDQLSEAGRPFAPAR